MADQALQYGLLAAEDASRRQADTAAKAHADRGLALNDGSDLRRQFRLRRLRRVRVRVQVLMRSRKAAQDIGHKAMEAHAHAGISFVLHELGDFVGAEVVAPQGLRVVISAGERWAQAYALGGAHAAAHARGRWPEAPEHARAARDAFAEIRAQQDAWSCWSGAACSWQAMGEEAAALAVAEAVLADVDPQGGWGECVEGPLYLYRVLSPEGDSRAPGLLATANRNLQGLADRFSTMVRSRALPGRIRAPARNQRCSGRYAQGVTLWRSEPGAAGAVCAAHSWRNSGAPSAT